MHNDGPHITKVASTSWFGNFLSMAGVELSQLPRVLNLIPGLNRLCVCVHTLNKRLHQKASMCLAWKIVPNLKTYFRSAGENWEGGAGGRGIRALTRWASLQILLLIFSCQENASKFHLCLSDRHIYQPPPALDLEQLTSLFKKNEGFMLVDIKMH